MKRFCECLPFLLKITSGFLLASVFYNIKTFKIETENSSDDRDLFQSTKLPVFVEKTIKELEKVKYVAHERFKDRRKLIKDYCDKYSDDKELLKVNNDMKWNQDLWFDYKYKLLFCQISKISSTTWISSLMA